MSPEEINVNEYLNFGLPISWTLSNKFLKFAAWGAKIEFFADVFLIINISKVKILIKLKICRGLLG